MVRMMGWVNMNRDELVLEVIAAVNATTAEQIAKVNNCMNDICLAAQLRRRDEFLISDLSKEGLEIVKAECIRKYRQ